MNWFKHLNMKKLSKDQIRKLVLAAAVIPVMLAAFAIKGGAGSEKDSIPLEPEAASEETVSGTIFVDIGGAVQSPMLAELPQGSRVEDAITAAGGLTEEADISSVNRAEFLEDGQKIYIPEKLPEGEAGAAQDTVGAAGYVPSAAAGTDGKININTADSTQLQELNGVGPATAQKIIDYRTSNGRFQSIEDIKNVSGIGDKTFDKLKDNITI
ncbi:MAG: helix-hairpin-helix domain-containing protein [Bacillota bacterium]|nr:helix-hairpin-helix domain-containing protein [Bacillota bacterium]